MDPSSSPGRGINGKLLFRGNSGSTVVEHPPPDQEVAGSNLARYTAFLLFYLFLWTTLWSDPNQAPQGGAYLSVMEKNYN